MPATDSARYECDNCGHIDTDATLIPEIKDYWERVDDDGPEPSGECSKCGCLSYQLPEETPVVFRWWRHGVIALFPTLNDAPEPWLCDSYEHVGQHGSADYTGIVRQSRPATPAEYRELKAELEAAPYHYQLRIITRSPGWRARRRRPT